MRRGFPAPSGPLVMRRATSLYCPLFRGLSDVHVLDLVGTGLDESGPRAWLLTFPSPTSNDAADAEVDVLGKEPAQRLFVVYATAT